MEKTSYFSESILNKNKSRMTLETVACEFSYFFDQIHLLHFQTTSYAEHNALNIWEDVVSAKDEFLEKMMGYMGRRVQAYDKKPIQNYSSGMPTIVVQQLKEFAERLEEFASGNNMPDIENLAQSLSGTCAKTLYLLTLK